MGFCVVFVLDSEPASERRDREACNVASGEDVVVPGHAAKLVDDDAVVDLESGGHCQTGLGLEAEPGRDDVGFDCPPGACGHPGGARGGHRFLRQYLDAASAVLLGHIGGQLRRQKARCDASLREDHGHPAAVRRQRRRELRANEAAADDDRGRALACPCSHRPVIVERPEVDNPLGARNGARPAASREHELLPAVHLASVVRRQVAIEVERDDATAQPKHRARLFRSAPDLRLVRSRPQTLRERRPRVGRMRLGADEHDRPVRVVLPDSFDGGVAGHPAAHDQVTHRLHCFSSPFDVVPLVSAWRPFLPRVSPTRSGDALEHHRRDEHEDEDADDNPGEDTPEPGHVMLRTGSPAIPRASHGLVPALPLDLWPL